jgi:hypothetical protein
MVEASLTQRAYTSIQQHFIDTGRAPHFTELAVKLGVTADEARIVQREAAEAGVGCWISHDTVHCVMGSFFQYPDTVSGDG